MEDRELQFLEALYRAHYQKLYLYAKAVVRHHELAEEAVQETFHIACGRIKQLQRSPNSAGWLVQTLKNVLRNMERSRSSLYASLQNLPYEEEHLGGRKDEESIELLYGGLLTEEEFLLLRRIVLERCSFLEAAGELGISVEACRKRMQRIREKLRHDLAP